MSHLTAATISVGNVSLPIVDCQHWCIAAQQPMCREGYSVTDCETCAVRKPRDGDLANPPLYEMGESRGGVGRRSKPQTQQPIGSVAAPQTGWRGLGDVIASATSALGIKPCGGCGRRRDALNRLVPFKPPAEQEILGDPNE